MKQHLFYLLLLFLPVINQAGSENETPETAVKNDLYTQLHLDEYGLSNEVFQLALIGHHKLEAQGKLENPNILTIVDFSQTSKNRRLYVIDCREQKLLFNTLVAHGRNTGDEYAKHFSNETGTLKSSLGFYITKKHITGSTVGYSLVLEGIEKGFNDNAAHRQIIMHGATYATEDFIKKNGRLGRSFGCPSLPPDLIQPVVETIENGSCLFIYYPDPTYLRTSSFLS